MPLLFTIAAVIPCRDRAEVITRSLRSVQRQSCPVDQIIIVDDGSRDDTASIIEAERIADPRIRLVRSTRSQGAAAARNLGVAHADADWIAFLDSDDEWLADKIALQMADLGPDRTAIASFTGFAVPRSGGPAVLRPVPSLASLRASNVLGTTSTCIVRRAAFLYAGGFDETLASCQDWDLWLRLLQIGPCVTVPQPLVRYHIDAPDRISRDLAKVLSGHRIVGARALGNTRGAERRRLRAAHHFRLFEILALELRRYGSAMPYLIAATLLSPGQTIRALAQHLSRRRGP
jgi:glycosyltransferase involved in cell wall biosynthesis